jgi:hypothetical protein
MRRPEPAFSPSCGNAQWRHSRYQSATLLEPDMTTILQINSAARSQGAQSTLLANELTAKLQQSNPGANVPRN